MTEKNDEDKPVTLADYIPPAAPEPKRRGLSGKDRERLDALEREMDEGAEKKPRRKGRKSDRKRRKTGMNARSFVFWAIVLMFVVAFVLD